MTNEFTYRIFDTITGISGILGLIITFLAWRKISTVQKAQEKERRMLRTLYDMQGLRERLHAAAVFLSTHAESNAKFLSQRLRNDAGRIEGIIDTQDYLETYAITQALPIREQYYTAAFLSREFANARQCVDTLMFRPMTLAGIDLVQGTKESPGLVTLAQKGIRVRILSLHPKAPADVINFIAPLLPKPFQNADEVRKELLDGLTRIRHCLSKQLRASEQEYIEYRLYRVPSMYHFLRRDRSLFLGFPFAYLGNPLNANNNPVASNYTDRRPYVEADLANPLAEKLMTHFESLWTDELTVKCFPGELPE